MNEQDVLGAFLLVNNPIVLSEEEIKDVQKAIKQLQQENKKLNGAIQTYDILLKANVEENKRLTQKITKALEKIEDYNLGKYDYSIPSIGVIELKEILEGKSK